MPPVPVVTALNPLPVSTSHWYVKPAPVAVTEKVAVWPSYRVKDDGSAPLLIEGAGAIISDAELRDVLKVSPGSFYSATNVDEDVNAIRNKYSPLSKFVNEASYTKLTTFPFISAEINGAGSISFFKMAVLFNMGTHPLGKVMSM